MTYRTNKLTFWDTINSKCSHQNLRHTLKSIIDRLIHVVFRHVPREKEGVFEILKLLLTSTITIKNRNGWKTPIRARIFFRAGCQFIRTPNRGIKIMMLDDVNDPMRAPDRINSNSLRRNIIMPLTVCPNRTL